MTRYVIHPDYAKAGDGKCWELWHPYVQSGHGPYCHLEEGHEGDHCGFGLTWATSPNVDKAVAAKFLDCYRAIPNSNHAIWLNDDDTVGMTLGGFRAATIFNGVGMYGD